MKFSIKDFFRKCGQIRRICTDVALEHKRFVFEQKRPLQNFQYIIFFMKDAK